MALRLLRIGMANNNRICCLAPQTVTTTSLSYCKQRCNVPTGKPEKNRKSLMKTATAKKLSYGLLDRFSNYMNRYEDILIKRFPNAMKIYRSFMDGVKFFYVDVKEFVRITRLIYLDQKSYKDLNRSDLELFHHMPKDIVKIAPVLVFSTLPLSNYLVFPLIYLFPRQLLTKHFWNIQQKSEFGLINMRHRLCHNKPVFRHLQSQLHNIPNDKGLRDKWDKILGQLGSGQHPTVGEILQCKDLFLGKPYHLLYISHGHARHLARLHDTHSGLFPKRRIADKANILIAMDRAIIREGGLTNLPTEALRNACTLRGYNPSNINNEDMIKWLTKWMQLSEACDKTCYSLLLHSPILIGYNEPNNLVLFCKPKQDDTKKCTLSEKS